MAAVEFALLLPVFIVVIVAAVVLGHAQFVRSRLSARAYVEARSCAIEMERNEEAPDCQSIAEAHFSESFAVDCDGGPVVQVSLDEDLAGVSYVRLVRLQVECNYTNGWLQLLAAQLEDALTFGHFTISAVVPYSVRSAEELAPEEDES